MSKWESERSIHEMLKDTPPLRESSDSITSGTEAKFPTSHSMPFTPTYGDGTNGAAAGSSTLVRAGSSKLESLRSWGVSTYKCTKQILYEKLGKSSRTVDTELEAQISSLRDTQRRYTSLLRLSSTLASQLSATLGTQRALADTFAELAQRSPDLRDPFLYNADTQRSLARNGEILLHALHFFNSSLNTLVNKTIEDTLQTARQYEAARVEYDAYRRELEAGPGGPTPGPVGPGGAAGPAGPRGPDGPLAERTRQLWAVYERLRDDSAVKLSLLHQNRVKVMNKQLVLFHNAVAAYFSGNSVALEAAVRQFTASPPRRPPAASPPPLATDH